MSILAWYVRVSLVRRVTAGLVLGALTGGALWYLSSSFGCRDSVQQAMRWMSPFGSVFVGMLKMIVVPTVFLSLVVGASSLPLQRLGRAGGRVLGWYFATMSLSAILGIVLARAMDPGAGSSLENWKALAAQFGAQARDLAGSGQPRSLGDVLEGLLLSLFQNPFQALSGGNFLGIIAFAILFGVSIRLVLEHTEDPAIRAKMEGLTHLFEAAMLAVGRIIDLVMHYSPIGVFFLSMGIFSVYGPAIIGPYVRVLAGIAGGILALLFVVYPLLIAVVVRKNPYRVLAASREAMLLAFATRSSAATLPVTLRVAEKNLKVRRELAGFALPLGATINMDGVCIHLPMFAILAANMFGIQLSLGDMVVMTVTTVLSAVGAGGVPGGSLMLLFIILGGIGLNPAQTSAIVALALGINPILDMFETMGNVTGDLLCTYSVASMEGLLDGDIETPGHSAGTIPLDPGQGRHGG
jgi:Na+/H+-dicarboxylate symporter